MCALGFTNGIKVYQISRFFMLVMLFVLPVLDAKSQPISHAIKIAIIQPFGVVSSPGSARYKANFENAVYYALGRNEAKVNECGAKYLVDIHYFSADSLVEARDLAKSIDQSDYWLLVGPIGVKNMMAVASMIKSMPVISLGSLIEGFSNKIITISKNIDTLAVTLAKKIATQGKVKNYGVLVDISCPECIAFEKSFDQEIKKFNVEKLFEVNSQDFEYQKDLSKLLFSLDNHKVDALLVPNYSKLSGYVMSKVHEKYPNIIFIGGDGWGKGDWSYLPQFKLPDSIEAYSIRTFFSDYNNSNVNSLDVLSGASTLAPSDLALSVIYLFDEMTNIICQNKFGSRDDFVSHFKSKNIDFMNKNTDIGFYKLSNGKLILEGKYFETH